METGETGELQSVSMVGRSGECQILIADPRVSRRHAMIRKQDGGFYLFDLGSFNGSYLNGVRVTAARKLESGDILNFADHEFRFQSELTEEDNPTMDDIGGSTIALIRSTPVIILVSDIKGFTSLSEKISPDDLAQIIGSWYSDCEAIMAEHGATVDKFIGDCVLAYWTKVNPQTIESSLKAARDLMAACEKTYQDRSDIFDASEANFAAGLALHTGKVAYGGMSQGEFTLLGDPVNLTFRLETLTRELGHPCVVSGDFVKAGEGVTAYTKSLGLHKVKGRAQGVEVHGLTSFPE